MTNNEIIQCIKVLESISKYKLPIPIMWKISKNIKIFQDIFKIYEQQRLNIINHYACRDEDGNILEDENGVKFPSANIRSSCAREINELLMQDNVLTINKIKLEDLTTCDDERYDALDIEQVSGLYFMIEE